MPKDIMAPKKNIGKIHRSLSLERKIKRTGIAFLLPWMLGMVYFFLIPVIKAFYWSLCDVKIADKAVETNFVGGKNYDYIFTQDPNYLRNIFSNLQTLAINVIVIIVFSLFVAVLLNQPFKGRSLVRSLFFLPVIVSSGIVIKILEQDTFTSYISSSNETHIFQTGSIINLLTSLGIQGSIVSLFTSLAAQIFDLSWRSGLQILLFLAALQAIPDTYKEVCDIEGANAWERFWTVIFPVVAPTTFIVFIYTVIDSFTDIRNVVMSGIMELFNSMQYGVAVASAMFYFLLILVLLGIVFFFVRRYVFTD